MHKSEFLNTLEERGFIHQCSDFNALDKILCQGTQSAYIGFDATARSLHVGSLLPIMMLYWLQQTGHKPIVLMGGGTSKIGDPSFKDDARKMLSDEDINANMSAIKSTCFKQFIKFGDGENDAVMVNNDDWLSELKYLEFLRDYGKHFTVNRMLGYESVRQRLDRQSPLTLLEFNYMVMQGYDFLELYRRYGTRIQMGGSDQWGNIINGVDLGRRCAKGELFALTSPLLTTSSGAKMGKTADGAVWLSCELLKPYDYYQYWRNTDDDDVEKFLKLFTTISMNEIKRLSSLQGQEINEAKKVLAFEATKMCHGKDAATIAQQTATEVFEQGNKAQDLPTIFADLKRGVSFINLLVESNLCASKGEAKRLIKGAGARIDDKPIKDIDYIYTGGETIKISAGKKKHALVKQKDYS